MGRGKWPGEGTNWKKKERLSISKPNSKKMIKVMNTHFVHMHYQKYQKQPGLDVALYSDLRSTDGHSSLTYILQ